MALFDEFFNLTTTNNCSLLSNSSLVSCDNSTGSSFENEGTGGGNGGAGGTTNPVLIGLEYANYVLQPTFLLLGLAGNCLTVIIMNSKRFSKTTSRYFLIALAIADSTLLLTQPFNKRFIMKMIGTDARALSDIGCKIFFVFFRTGKMTSSWFVVFICLERFIAVWFPLKIKLIVTKRNALIGIASVIVVIGGFNTGWSYCSKIKNGFCFPDVFDKSDPVEVAIYGRMLAAGCALYSFIPIGCLSVFTPMILIQLARVRQARMKLTNTNSAKTTESVKTTAMLLLVMVAYIIFVTPVTTLHITAYFLGVNSFGSNADGFLIYRDVVQILEQVNYSINFFIYVVASQQFRTGLFAVLKIDKCMARIKNSKKSSSSGKTKQTSKGKTGSGLQASNSDRKDKAGDEGGVEVVISKNAEHLEKYS